MDRMANRNQGAEEEIPSPMLRPNLIAAAAAGAGYIFFPDSWKQIRQNLLLRIVIHARSVAYKSG
jgi:hypothetical protein